MTDQDPDGPSPIVGYTDFPYYTNFVHFNENTGNFVELVGEREYVNTNATGPFAETPIAFTIRKIGSLCTFILPATLSAAETVASQSAITLPAGSLPTGPTSTSGGNFVPASEVYLPVILVNNSAYVPGYVLLGTDGSMVFTLASGTFSGPSGIASTMFSYYAVV
jgi:hypothetical protein